MQRTFVLTLTTALMIAAGASALHARGSNAKVNPIATGVPLLLISVAVTASLVGGDARVFFSAESSRPPPPLEKGSGTRQVSPFEACYSWPSSRHARRS
jgi:hypothetical protein